MSFTVQEVAQLLKQAKDNKKPYVFFTGAGCSITADVPSATGLIDEIREKFKIQVKNIDIKTDRYNYGKYMSALDKDERRSLLKPHIIDNKKINWAHIALACLMQGGYIQRVLTFNFDSVLSRACNMLGLHPSTYDFATANPHLYHLINDPSIVHLHGQGTGFVQLNTGEETEKHTEKLGDFIAATLNSNPSLFIGYSGNADAFFPLLEEKYSEQHRLIWTGTKDKIDDIESQSVKKFLIKNNNITHYIGEIYADNFLIQLAKELDCFPPELFLNPYTFLNKQLDFIQPYPLADGLDVLNNLREYLKEQSDKPLIESLYTAFIHKYPDKESIKDLPEKAIDDIIWAYDKQARLFRDTGDFDSGLKLYQQAVKIQHNHVGCLNNYGNFLTQFAKLKQDESIYLKSFEQLEKALKIKPNDADVLNSYGVALSSFAEFKQDEKFYLKAFENYEKGLKIKLNDANLLGNYGNALSKLAQLKKDEVLYLKALKQYEKALEIQPSGALLLENYGNSLSKLAQLKKDEELYLKALEQYKKLLLVQPNKTYNLACYYLIRNNFDLAKTNLLHAEQHNTLPNNPFQHLNNDTDLDSIRNESWFIELLDRLKEKVA